MAEKLFDNFPQVSPNAWNEKIHADLKGKDNDSLNWSTEDGIVLKPFYTSEDYPTPLFVPGSKAGWIIRQDFKLAEPEIAKHFINEPDPGINLFGFVIHPEDKIVDGTLSNLLAIAGSKSVEISILPPEITEQVVDSLIKEIKISGIDPKKKSVSIEVDLAKELYSGRTWNLKLIAEMIRKSPPLSPDLCISALPIHLKGGTPVQELALQLSLFVEITEQLLNEGLTSQEIFSKTLFRLPVGLQFFPEIAKLRALKILIAAVVNKFGVSLSIPVHSISSLRNFSSEDIHNNLLRSTTQAAAAILGGCDQLSILPFDILTQPSGTNSIRLARNIQLLLREESYLGKVADASAGSWYIDSLTEKIAKEAWKEFMEIEKHGGFLQSWNHNYFEEILIKLNPLNS